jgi:hypothetical protein
MSRTARLREYVVRHFDELADDVRLSSQETAAVIGQSYWTLAYWRSHEPDHPLRYEKRRRSIHYKVGDVRIYLRSRRELPPAPPRRGKDRRKAAEARP